MERKRYKKRGAQFTKMLSSDCLFPDRFMSCVSDCTHNSNSIYLHFHLVTDIDTYMHTNTHSRLVNMWCIVSLLSLIIQSHR